MGKKVTVDFNGCDVSAMQMDAVLVSASGYDSGRIIAWSQTPLYYTTSLL